MSSHEITITVQDNRNVRARKDNGAEAADEIELDSLRRATVEVFEDWLRRGQITRRRELEVLGTHLYRMLFNGKVGAAFEQALKEAPKGRRLRVQLSFQEEAAELASLPWEYLYSPDTETRRGFFLCTNVDLVLSRYMPLDVGREALEPDESPLRILIVVSEPNDLGPVVAKPVIEAIHDLGDVFIDVLEKTTINNFLKKLEDVQPHVLHFIGHGRYNKEEKSGEIALLESEEGPALWVPDRGFAEFFPQIHVYPRLVFLHLCESATVNFTANFAGLAPQLIRAGIQAVVAMQYPITNRAAIAFSRTFYRELAKGEPVDSAVQVGRWRITTDEPGAYNSRVFGTPVLYMHSRDGIIRVVKEGSERSLKSPSYRSPGISTTARRSVASADESRQEPAHGAEPPAPNADEKGADVKSPQPPLDEIAKALLNAYLSTAQRDSAEAEKASSGEHEHLASALALRLKALQEKKE